MTEEKIEHRWLVVIGGVLIIMCLGVAYAWGVFLMPIAKEFGWGRGETSLAVSILLLVFSVFMVVGGILEKKYGPRITASAGGVFVCLGWVLAYWTNSLWWLYLSYGVLAGIGTGLGYLPAISTGIKWFPDKRGLVTGIIIFGFGFGAAFLTPLAVRFIELYGWRTTMLIYGAGFGVIIIGAAQLLKTPPANWRPPGWAAQKETGFKIIANDFSPRQMLKTTTFRLMFVTYFIAMVAGMMAVGHISAFANDAGYTLIQAAFTITVLAIANGLGRIVFGALSDKIGRTNTLGVLFLLMALGMILLPYMTILFALYTAAGIVGFCFGGFLAVYPAATGDFFGIKDFGTNYGLVFIGYGAGCFAGPWLGGVVYDITGSYSVAFIAAGILSLCGGIITLLFLKPPKLSEAKIGNKTYL
ncbi:MAG: OFA family MFS transporter [Candidatus Omnitrophica bacterium]|nr:OFA family MFS transporter [Candidatus Omnitrophota bacterium]MBU2504852.1 OFA family MFS transporter [Candidatus Omnitrophota bacterium]